MPAQVCECVCECVYVWNILKYVSIPVMVLK